MNSELEMTIIYPEQNTKFFILFYSHIRSSAKEKERFEWKKCVFDLNLFKL